MKKSEPKGKLYQVYKNLSKLDNLYSYTFNKEVRRIFNQTPYQKISIQLKNNKLIIKRFTCFNKTIIHKLKHFNKESIENIINFININIKY